MRVGITAVKTFLVVKVFSLDEVLQDLLCRGLVHGEAGGGGRDRRVSTGELGEGRGIQEIKDAEVTGDLAVAAARVCGQPSSSWEQRAWPS